MFRRLLALLLCVLLTWQPSFALTPAQQLILSGGYRPAVNLDFTKLTAASPLFTANIAYSGGTNGTVVNASGLIVPASGPRFTYDPVTLQPLGLLIEEARTNLAWPSVPNTLTNWQFHGGDTTSTLTQNAGIAPDGTNTAVSLNNPSGVQSNAGFGIWVAFSLANTIGTISLWMKSGSTSSAQLNITPYSSDGSMGGGVVTLTNQWKRFTVTATATDANGYRFQVSTNATAGNILIWGAQLEAGSFPTSYIPTTSSAVTRAADVVQAQGPLLAALQGAAFSTAVELSNVQGIAAAPYVLQAGAAGELITINAGKAETWIASGGHDLYSGTLSPSLSAYPIFRMALGQNSSGRSITGTGAILASDAYSFTGIASVSVGGVGGSRAIDGTISKLAAWNTRLPDAKLQAFTRLNAQWAANDNLPEFANDDVPIAVKIAAGW